MIFGSQRSRLHVPGFAAMLVLTANLAPAQYSQSGRVVMWNGDPLPGVAQVELVCRDGRTYKLAVTNPDGSFNAGVGLLADASERDPKDRPKYMNNCQMRAILPGYVSSTASNGVRRIVLWPPERTKVDASATNSLVPAKSRIAFENGLRAMKDGDMRDAEAFFQQSVEIYDGHAQAWYMLGKVFRELEQPDEARRAFLKAVAADPQYVNPYQDLYQLAFERDDMEDLLKQTEALLGLNPQEFPQAYYYNAVANLQLKHYEAGEESIRTVIENFPVYEQPLEYYVLGFLLANQGRTADALEAFDTFLTLQPEGGPANQARAARETLQKRLGAQADGGTTQ